MASVVKIRVQTWSLIQKKAMQVTSFAIQLPYLLFIVFNDLHVKKYVFL